MKYLKLLHIGDIHYPEAKKKTLSDLKDTAFPSTVSEKVVTRPYQAVMRAVKSQCDEGIDGILVSGDLTSNGMLRGYKECLDYLIRALEIHDSRKWRSGHIHVVPGNHDVDRNLCHPDSESLFSKFEPLAAAWAEINLEHYFTKKIRKTELLSSQDCRAVVFSLNSCIGCGEKRFLPEGIRKELHRILQKYAQEKGMDDAFALVGEQLDTPAFLEEDIHYIYREINTLDNHVLPIILAHHNILPQAVPRIAMYSEVLNAGLVRSRLSKCHSSVLYCHGHIHSDPVELVQNPNLEYSPLVCISAPEFVVGFNLLKVEYANNLIPLGCVVEAYRIHEDGTVDREHETRIPLYVSCNCEKLEEFGDGRVLDFFPYIPKEWTYFPQILERIRDQSGTRIHTTTLSDALLQVEWLGIVQILNRNRDPKYWHVRKLLA